MASVNITKTIALFPSAVFLQWDIEPEESGDHVVDVYRAGAPNGPWQPVVSSLLNAYHTLDNKFNLPPATNPSDAHYGLNLFSLSRDVYYMVTVTPPSGTANAFSSAAVSVEPGLDIRTRLFKRKILRDEATAFRRLNGIPIAVLKRRHWGPLCPECYDPVTRESTREHCPICFGTTFVDGYWAPVYIRGRKSTSPVQSQITAQGVNDQKVVTFVILDMPGVEFQDVLIDLRTGNRFEVQIVSGTELKGVTVHQSITASELSRSSIEYAVKVDPVTTPPLY